MWLQIGKKIRGCGFGNLFVMPAGKTKKNAQGYNLRCTIDIIISNNAKILERIQKDRLRIFLKFILFYGEAQTCLFIIFSTPLIFLKKII